MLSLTMPPAAVRPVAPRLYEGAEVPEGVELYNFGDPDQLRSRVYQAAHTAASNFKPLQNQRFTMALRDVHYDGKEKYTPKEETQAVLRNTSLARRLRGTWELRDNATGDVVDQRKMTIAHVPYVTSHGTILRNGVSYAANNQQRLLSGVFTRERDNGEVESHVNVLPGQGFTHRYYLDPAKQTFQVEMQQARLPLLPILRLMGAKDEEIKEAWGDELFEANATQKNNAQVLPRIYTKFVGKQPTGLTQEQMAEGVRQALGRVRMDPDVNAVTLGQPFERLDPTSMLAISKRLLGVAKGEQDVDDRDDLSNQRIYGLEDLLQERMSRDIAGSVRKAFYKAAFKGSLQNMPQSVFDKAVDQLVLKSGLVVSPEETNPSEMFDRMYRLTKMGQGGIPSTDSIPLESRTVLPSHLNMIDPSRTPESERVGVELFIASGARKGSDGRLYSRFKDAKTGKPQWLSSRGLRSKVIAFPGEMASKEPYARALKNGQITYAKKEEVDVEPLHFEHAFSPLGNLIPFKSTSKPHRSAMGSRMLTQAVSLINPESQLVRTANPGTGSTFAKDFGNRMGAVRAEDDAYVDSVTDDQIVLKTQSGETKTVDLYNNYPYNRKSLLHQTPMVKPGQHITAGTLLAKSNYTDDQGDLALGMNVRMAFLPFRSNYEDAVVVSEGLAKRGTSIHAYQSAHEWKPDQKKGVKTFASLFPRRYKPEQLSKLTEDGYIKPGQEVQYGDPLIVAVSPAPKTRDKAHKAGAASWRPEVTEWKHKAPGKVTSVENTDKGVVVVVRTEEQLQVGDKLSGLHGNKGVVSEIIPDEEMPKDGEGRPFEVLLDPGSLISRANDAQVFEALLGKIAAKTGKRYDLEDFDKIEDAASYVQSELDKNGVPRYDDVIHPETGKKIPAVTTGLMHFVKLHHMADHKVQGRGVGSYTADDEPAKGFDGQESSKRMAGMHTAALLSHGALDMLWDIKNIRGQRDDIRHGRFMQGQAPPAVKVPLRYEKFLSELQGAGIRVIPDGPQLHIMSMTDKGVTDLAGEREIKNGDMVRMGRGHETEDYVPLPGGLFDPKLTGGHQGNRWSFIRLAEPMPNPIMADPIRNLLGLTEKKFEAVLFGEDTLGDKTGPSAIYDALKAIDVDREITKARTQIESGKKTWRDAAVKKLRFLKASKESGDHPSDWMLTKMPVLPPKFRPISKMEATGLPVVSNPNYLYQALLEARDNFAKLKDQTSDLAEERKQIYRTMQAVTGLGDPVQQELKDRNVKGLLDAVLGSSPKYNRVQRQLIATPVDMVGRAVVTPDPDLDMDHIGIPEEAAWNLYRPFVARRLTRLGVPLDKALEAVENRSPLARKQMLEEMETRPVIADRAPVLHKLGILAFWPKLAKGSTLRASPLITKGFTLDFDGDQMNFGVPVDAGAVKDAVERMLPSKNLISSADLRNPVATPQQMYLAGLYLATRKGDTKARGEPVTFASRDAALKAIRRGEIDYNTPIEFPEDPKA